MRAIDNNSTRPGPPAAAMPVPEDVSGAIATALNILQQWELSREQQCAMLGIAERSWYQWKRDAPARVAGDTLERVSYILGIWKALRQLFPSREEYKRWPRLENTAPPFGGRPPIERMASGQVGDLYAVRTWLDGWRGW
ncbi:MAG: MbcA/ParS/Xre antitoxin family protein [Xanthomonadaceae bacterium]|nr:MbcA/ParS/Xre antitoxin family protein [Xanthomonadaceae bacterium]